MNKNFNHLHRFVALLTIVLALLSGSAFFLDTYCDWSDVVGNGSMGVTHDAAIAIQDAIDANGGHWPSNDVINQALVGAGLLEEGQWNTGGSTQSSAPATAPSTEAASSKPSTSSDSSKKETEPEPEEESEEPHEHDYHMEITKSPTCTEDGVKTYTCDCGDSYTEAIPSTGHTEGQWETEKEPSCEVSGNKIVKCTVCGETLKEEAIPPTGHSLGEWEINQPAGWVREGARLRRCTICGEIVETEAIPANHTPLYIIGGSIVAFIVILVVVIIIVVKRKNAVIVPNSKKDVK